MSLNPIPYLLRFFICLRLRRGACPRLHCAHGCLLWLLSAVVCMVLAGCKDGDSKPTPPKPQPRKVVEQAPPEPSAQDVRVNLLPFLADFPMVKLGEVRMSCAVQEDGSVIISANAAVCTEENLYSKEEAPPVFNVERKEVNSALNRAMLPDASYLLQVGADPSMITDEDRAPKALPPDLQKQADALKHFAECPVYRLQSEAGSLQNIPASMRAIKKGTRWDVGDVSFDTSPMHGLQSLIPERALPKDAVIVSDNFEAKRRARIREMVDAFNAASQPYIEGREAAARSRVLETQARNEESQKAQAEQAEQRRLCHEAWQKACSAFLRPTATFSGEWSRGNSFGKFSLRISDVSSFPDALQFIGTLSDSNLPEAVVNVVGRCQPSDEQNEPIPCVIHIYHGRYDPDVPTAEVFDKHDALLLLTLSPSGSLTGSLTSESWKNSPEKNFRVQFKPNPSKNK